MMASRSSQLVRATIFISAAFVSSMLTQNVDASENQEIEKSIRAQS